MKNLVIALLLLVYSSGFAQNTAPAFDGHSWKPPYSLPMEEWGIERFLLPPDFAPKIKYAGVEDLRFTKGWGNVKSDEYWSYAFLWFLDGKPAITTTILESNLNFYYDGLVGSNIEKRKIPAEKVFPAKAAIIKINTAAGDVSTFSGSITMLDYMEQKPIVNNCIIHLKYCTGQDKTFLFYEISPQPATHAVWQSLNKLWTDFDCNAPAAK